MILPGTFLADFIPYGKWTRGDVSWDFLREPSCIESEKLLCGESKASVEQASRITLNRAAERGKPFIEMFLKKPSLQLAKWERTRRCSFLLIQGSFLSKRLRLSAA